MIKFFKKTINTLDASKEEAHPESKFNIGQVVTAEYFYSYDMRSAPVPTKITGEILDKRFRFGRWEYDLRIEGFRVLTHSVAEKFCYTP